MGRKETNQTNKKPTQRNNMQGVRLYEGQSNITKS